MKLNCICLFFFLSMFMSLASSGQAFMQSAGFSIIRGTTKPTAENGGIKMKMAINGITYFPRIAVMQTSTNSLSIGIPFSLGFKGNASSGGNSVAFGLDLPLAVDFNFGHKSSSNNESGIGGYIGAGFGITHVSLSETSSYGTYSANANSHGPLARAGIRFGIPIGRETLSFTLGGFYKIGLEKEKFRVGGGSLLMDF